jgi:hypothetical protein
MWVGRLQGTIEKLRDDSRPHWLSLEKRKLIANRLLVERHYPTWWESFGCIKSDARCGHFCCEVQEGGPWLAWGPSGQEKGPRSGLFKGEWRPEKITDIEDWPHWSQESGDAESEVGLENARILQDAHSPDARRGEGTARKAEQHPRESSRDTQQGI